MAAAPFPKTGPPPSPAPIVPAIDPAKVAALIALPSPKVLEVASVGWYGGQTWIHYSDARWDVTFPALSAYNLTGIQARFTPDSWLANFTRTSDLSDDTMDLAFNDTDWNITALWWGYGGEGVPVIITQYFPDVDLLVEIFDGYLRTPKGSNGYTFPVTCSNGFRSPNLQIPRRVIYSGCSALFGGLINPTTNQPWFPTQPLIDENDCPYNRHIGGSYGTLNGAVPWTDCPRQRPSDCILRLAEPSRPGGVPNQLSYLGFDVIVGSEVIGTPWNGFMANIRANETALKIPIRVVYGAQRLQEMTLLAYEAQSGGNNPDAGFLRTIWVVCEGPIVGMGPAANFGVGPDSDGNPGPSTKGLDSSIRVNDQVITCDHVDWSGSFGMKYQNAKPRPSPIGGGLPNQLNYSGTAVVNLDYGRGDFRNFTPDNIKGTVKVYGKKDVRVYTAPTTFTRTYTTNRAWCLFDMLTNKRYGYGLDRARFIISEWIALAAWCNETVSGYDDSGTTVNFTRSTFNGVVDGRSAQNVLGDFCLMGRFTPPFQDQGKLRVLPLREDEAPDDPTTFTGPVIADFDNDFAPSYKRNIIFESGASTLSYSIKSDAELTNQLKYTFNDANYDDTERPLVIQDLNAQLLAGRANGDLSFREVSKSLAGFGINNLPEAARMATMLLYYGENDSGGLRSNFTVTFKTWSILGKLFGLHPYQVIRVLSRRVNRFTERGTLEFPSGGSGAYAADCYQWFRITKLKRTSKLVLEVEAQLYAKASLTAFRSIQAAAGSDNPAGQTTTNPGPQPPIIDLSPITGAGIQIKAN